VSKPTTLLWMRQGSPNLSGDLAKNWKNERRGGQKRFYHTIRAVVYFFVREALQNMKDAWANQKYRSATASRPSRFELTARFVTHHKDEAKKILAALGIDETLEKVLGSMATPPDAADADAWAEYKKVVETLLKGNKVRVLYMEETNASGMFYDPETDRDSLLTALYSHNQGNPQAGAGGSYGHGKGALAKASKLKTNVAYTNTDWCKNPYNKNRLMGVVSMPSFQAKASDGKVKWHSGFGLLVAGTRTDDDVNGELPVPFEDAAADAKAQALGMTVRGKGEHGTTMMIVEPEFDAEEFKRAAALYWLPAILGGSLKITVVEEHRGDPGKQGKTYEGVVNPEEEAALAGFCAAHRLLAAETLTPSERASIDVNSFEVYKKSGVGSLAIVATKHNAAMRVDEDEKVLPQIVYSRSRGIGLVISYTQKNISLPQGLDVRAHFQADPDLEALLRASEPKAHDDWSKAEISREKAKKITELNEHIDRSIGEFVQKLRGDQSQEAKALDVASQAWNKIGQKIGKSPKAKNPGKKQTGGGRGGPRIDFEGEDLDSGTGFPLLKVKVVSKSDLTIDVRGVLHVLDDYGKRVFAFDARSVTVTATASGAPACLTALDDPNNPGSLKKAVDEKHHMEWEVMCATNSGGENAG